MPSVLACVGAPDKDGIPGHSPALALMQSPEDNVHNGEISPEEFDRLSLLLRPPTERTPEDSSPMDTSPSPFTGLHCTEGLIGLTPWQGHPDLTCHRMLSCSQRPVAGG